ncbi:MAG TPA: APC family permease [Bryobacteraceae bacterium]|nr:APC family permease [Bryobacteraceae bacterium]
MPPPKSAPARGDAASHPDSAHIDHETGFVRELGLFDSAMIVIGVMIGSGIFIVPADMARNLGSPGWLLVAWLVTGVLTVSAALSYGELSAMMPRAGGMYVYLREAFSPMIGFLYGWTLFTVIQTGTIAAVAVAFARYIGVLLPGIAEDRYLIPPIHLSSGYAVSLSTGQFVAILVIVALTWMNSLGVRHGKILQNVFTTAKIAALAALILAGLVFAKHDAIATNFGNFWTPHDVTPITASVSALTTFGLFAAICVSQSGSLFSADSWHDITFAGGEVKEPHKTLPRALALGTICVSGLYLLANLAYLLVLPLDAIQHSPSDRVATAMLQRIFPGWGAVLMAVAIMVSTFGCVNALILSGPRVSYSMAKDGLFPKAAGRLNAARVPGWSLLIQGIWSAALVLPRTIDVQTHAYGSLYSNLLDYVISAAVIFYVLTIAGVIRLRITKPNAPRPYRAFGYPVVPLVYIVGGVAILYCLFVYRPATTWPGLLIVLCGVPVYWLMRSRASTLR